MRGPCLHRRRWSTSLEPVSRRLYQLAASLVLILATLTPLMELFDHWDPQTTVPANDTELNVAAFFAGVGLVLTLAKLLRHVAAPASLRNRFNQAAQLPPVSRSDFNVFPGPTESPPFIPLRI